eukprot:COSAG03_NODE_15958_length_415_cov_1.411392_1_plen_43_part_10
MLIDCTAQVCLADYGPRGKYSDVHLDGRGHQDEHQVGLSLSLS